jgi:plastocyanin domain-containing protein
MKMKTWKPIVIVAGIALAAFLVWWFFIRTPEEA